MLVGNRRLLDLIAVVGTLASLGLPAQSLPAPAHLDLRVKGQGRIVATIEQPTAAEQADVACINSCPLDYLPDRVVTLKAEGLGAASFGFWSDDRCPPGPVCKLVIDSDDQTVVASFSPQPVLVAVSNNSLKPGSLTSTPPGLTCDHEFTLPGMKQLCHGEFPLSTEVKLKAEGVTPVWGPGLDGHPCDAVEGATCSLTVRSQRRVALNFGGPKVWPTSDPGDIGVVFRVAKDGTGSGTVRSQLLDCGASCHASIGFGKPQTLVADAARGSRFVGWRGACDASPRCTLEVGPVTRITAVFDSASPPGSQPPETKSPEIKASGTQPVTSQPEQSKQRPRSQSPFVARVGRRIVVRGVPPRRILFTVGVNARSSIRAVLANARGQLVSSHTWTVGSGSRMLRLGLPRRARRGTYVLKVTARDGADNVKRFERRVRLRR
ncbi:MAG: hypothetical protein QOD83_3067 [Solirubrobacteraceae bacterium]|jgi:hypothetical protein|nr:hypothetical protein [Solirubrobacteraceae bacterium]